MLLRYYLPMDPYSFGLVSPTWATTMYRNSISGKMQNSQNTADVRYTHYWYLKEKTVPFGKISSLTPWVKEIISAKDPFLIVPKKFFTDSRVSNAPFRTRMLRGEMVITPYTICKLTSIGEGKKVSSTRVASRQRRTAFRLNDLGLPSGYVSGTNGTAFGTTALKHQGKGSFTKPQTVIVDANTHQEYYIYEDVIDEGRDDFPLASLYRRLLSYGTVDEEIVTSVLADANSGEMDLLTSFAELPKTLDWLASLVYRLVNAYQAFKRKEFSVFTRLQLDRPVYPTFGSMPEWKRMKQIKKMRREYNEKVFKSYDKMDLPDAIAQVRLEFVYAIKPLIKDVEDTIKGIDKIGRQFLTKRHRLQKDLIPPDLNDWSFVSGSLIHQQRYFCKRSYQDSGFASSFFQVFTLNSAITALELVPIWGTVLQYITNLGDYLRAFGIPPDGTLQKFSVSDGYDMSLRYRHTDGSEVTVSGYLYNRHIIDNAYSCTSITLTFPTIEQVINIFAIAWVSMRGKLRSTPLPQRQYANLRW